MNKYQIIYADPPWNYKDACNDGKRGAVHKYSTMKLPAIKALPVDQLAADNSILFLWVTAPMMAEGLQVVKAWGFTYKTVGFTWTKLTSKGKIAIGMGHYTRANAEFCLIGLKGKGWFKRFDGGVPSALLAPRRAHSQKPDEVRDRIVRLCGDVPRLELFARQATPGGWDVWGDEVDSDINMEDYNGQ